MNHNAWPQRLLALPFLILGGWCLATPQMVERLTINPAYLSIGVQTGPPIGAQKGL